MILPFILLALAQAPDAAASTAPTPAPPHPVWTALPSARDLERYYPSRARRRGVTGSATIQCSVDENGRLVDCRVISEAPQGWNLGDAALGLSRKFRLAPRTTDGESVAGGTVTIPLYFGRDGASRR
jgi:protein TonB